MDSWLFNEQRDVAVFSTKHVINDREPILYVFHDNDGAWQFHNGVEINIEDAMVVSLGEVYDLDNSIGLVAFLPVGSSAKRKSMNEKWEIF